MTLMTAYQRTNETGFIGKFLELPERRTIKSFISINVAAIAQDIRDVIADWEDLDLDDLLPTVPFGRPSAYPADEVSAVGFIESALRISVDRVLTATGIKPRTYYGWREGGRKPRASSVGDLWSAVEALYYLAQSHPNLSAWFKDNSDAQDLFDAGQFAELARLEVDWLVRNYGPAPTQAPYSHLDDIAAGPTHRPGARRSPQINPVIVSTSRIERGVRRTDD